MNKLKIRLFTSIAFIIVFLSGCATGTQFVLLGESSIPGSMAVQEVNIAISNANANGCKAISVGGYGLAPEDLATVVGIPVLVDCPKGIKLLPNGTLAP